MNTETKPVVTETSPEDKFFGVTTSIDDMTPPEDKDEKLEVVVTSDADTVVKKKDEIPAKTTDEDIEQYGEKVQKRINKLTWQAKEANRQREESEKMRNEAVLYAQSVNRQNQEQAHIISTGEAHLVERVKTAATLAVEVSRAKYKKAYEEGNTDAILAAQEEIIQAQAGSMSAASIDAEYQNRVRNWTHAQQAQQAQQYQQRQQYIQNQQQQPAVQPPPTPTAESSNWAQQNPWFGNPKHRDMTAIAYAKHETLINDQHVKSDSDEYYEAIDSEVRKRFPEYFSDTTQGKPFTVVAPSSRNSGGKSKTVHLEPEEVALAKTLGVSLELYAAQKGVLQ